MVTHSHGGNVATAATNDDLVAGATSMDELVVIAKPYFSADPTILFKAHRKRIKFYDPDLGRIHAPVLSISSPEDEIQTTVAEKGAFDRPPIGYGDVTSSRQIQVPALAPGFIDVQVKTSVGWYDAHGVLHDAAMGRAIGIYLRMGGHSAADWERARRLAGVPDVITNGKDKGD